MSESGVAPLQRDIRSASKPFKRDRDSSEKWSMGTRPLAGVRIKYRGPPGSEDVETVGSQAEKVRPCKPWTSPAYKSHANKNSRPPGPSNHYGNGFSDTASQRCSRKLDARVDADEHASSPLSKSLLELLPHHANRIPPSIQPAIRDQDSGVLYSFDNAGASPGVKGRAVGLDSLVDQAEKKWIMEQTEKIVQGEYEVLDAAGETTALSKKKKGSPKQKLVPTFPAVVAEVEEDDGFELI